MVTITLTKGGARRVTRVTLPPKASPGRGIDRRNYSWLGLSGERYACAVFKAGEEPIVRTFTDAAIIAVYHMDGVRRAVYVLAPRDFDGFGRQDRVRTAIELGANEWHVHLSDNRSGLAADLGCR